MLGADIERFVEPVVLSFFNSPHRIPLILFVKNFKTRRKLEIHVFDHVLELDKDNSGVSNSTASNPYLSANSSLG